MADSDQWNYPALTKPTSDGAYSYHIQRRLSVWFSVWLARHITANAATGLDLIFGIAAATLVLLDNWVWGAILLQVFGIFSCVDGEIARIQDRSSRIGDFLDTMTDRTIELLIIGAIAFSLSYRAEPSNVLAASLGLLGGVFLLTASSEKFRSSYQTGYPKRRLEKIFGLFCAGSDSRLLVLSLGLIISDLTGNSLILLWILWMLTAAIYLNFLVRIRLIYKHFKTENVTEQP